MTRAAAALLLSLWVVACSAPVPTGSPATAMPSSAAPSASASSAPTATPVPASATPVAAATPCPVPAVEGEIPFDRLVDVEVVEGDRADLVVFSFERSSTPPPQGPASGSLELAEPPYTQGASGLPIEMRGEHVIIVRFDGQTLATEEGEPVFVGPLESRPDLPALRDVVNFDLFEGIAGWYIGWDGPGCVALETTADQVVVSIAHPG